VKKRKSDFKIISILKVLLITILVGLLVTYFFVQDIEEMLGDIFAIVLYSLFIGSTLWAGNDLIVRTIEKHPLLIKKPERKFIIVIIVVIIYSFIAIIFVSFIWHVFWLKGNISEFNMPSFQHIAVLLGVTFIITFGTGLKEFIHDEKENIIREEKLKMEIIKLQYETLKNQVNPHFLFNSLNALTSLVAENDDAVRFIKNLADVYRYVLDQKDKELVDFKQELNFVSAYLYLHQIRFGKNLEVNVCKAPPNKMVVPLAVQMLVENAIKHNEISVDAPLKISIFIENDFVVVENNSQLKSMVTDSSKIGLGNIKSRYEYLTDIKLIIGEFEGKFIVKLPLLEVKKI
jgi:sensor histidine kinase YesM